MRPASKGNIHLWTIRSTSRQGELSSLLPEKAVSAFLGRSGLGTATAFLVGADTIDRAVWETDRAFHQGISAETPIAADKIDSKAFWLVVFLGNNRIEPGWDVGYVELLENTVTFAYRKKPSRDCYPVRHFVYWVPLGKLGQGSLTINLLDLDQNQIIFSRYVDLGTGAAMHGDTGTPEKGSRVARSNIYGTGDPKVSAAGRFCREKGPIASLDEMTRYRAPLGPSNLLLLEGKDLSSVIEQSADLTARGKSMDDTAQSGEDSWLFVSLGQRPQGYWAVESVTVRPDAIRFSYRRTNNALNPGLLHYYWIRVGRLPSNSYHLELYDADVGRVSVMRRVTVTGN
ncbi:MAG: hypothetical protein U0793_10680 [Gemmataceae bacterium]